MISYKKWKQLNENIGMSYTLGLAQPNKVGQLQSRWDELASMPSMPSIKKSKKMMGDVGEDMPPMKKGKFGKKPPLGPTADDLGSSDGDAEAGDVGDLDMGDEDHPHDEEDEDHPHDEEGEDLDHDDAAPDMGDDEGDMGDEEGAEETPPPMLPKKKGGFLDKAKGVADGAKMMSKGASKMVKAMKESKMTKEQKEFLNSLKSQTGGTFFKQDDDGSWSVQEDALIPPTDANAEVTQSDEEPVPGEVGYAPQGRVGSVGSFQEWSKKYKS
jgi:hypothetical protein